jgi:putative FmdB family regulatory protein
MPIYEYRCSQCRNPTDELQPMGAAPPGPCTVCGGELRRVYGRVGVRFSGWGFDKTDALVPERRRRQDFKALQRKAEEIAEG